MTSHLSGRPPHGAEYLSIEQTARVLGIGRTMAYAQGRAWLATGGAEGFPCRRIGRLLRVYRVELEAWLGFAITWPPSDGTATDPVPVVPQHPTTPTTRPRATRSRSRVAPNQATLPF